VESTGSYWRPVFNLLQEQCEVVEVLVVNAYHVKALPGRKTDVKDAEWLGDLLRLIRHGLLRASVIPAPAQRQLRALTRALTRDRIHLVDERARLINRLQTVLEDAKIQLASVVTDRRGLLSARDLAAPARRRDRRAGAGRVGAGEDAGQTNGRPAPRRSLAGCRLIMSSCCLNNSPIWRTWIRPSRV
jgi:transposase